MAVSSSLMRAGQFEDSDNTCEEGREEGKCLKKTGG